MLGRGRDGRPERWARDLPPAGVGTYRQAAPTLPGMDLAQHAAVLWRFRAVVAGGDRPRHRAGNPRGLPASLVQPARLRDLEQRVLAARHPVGLPGGPRDAARPRRSRPARHVGSPRHRGRQLEFADPDRLSALASLYAQLADRRPRAQQAAREARRPRRSRPRPSRATPSTQLPVIKLTTFAATAARRARAQHAHRGGARQGARHRAGEEQHPAAPADPAVDADQRARRRPSRRRAARTPRRSWRSCSALLGSLGAGAPARGAARRAARTRRDSTEWCVPWAVTDTARRGRPGPESEPMPREPVTAHVAEPTRRPAGAPVGAGRGDH